MDLGVQYTLPWYTLPGLEGILEAGGRELQVTALCVVYLRQPL